MVDLSKNPSADQVCHDALVHNTYLLLDLCSERQQTLFHRLYPDSIEDLDDQKLASAYELVRRTVAKNEVDPTRLR